MAIDAALDLGYVTLLFGALILAWLAYMVAQGVAALIGWVPAIGPAAANAVEAAMVAPAKGLADSLEKRITQGLSTLVDDVAVLVSIPLLLAYGLHKAFDALWNDATKGLVKAVAGGAQTVATRALNLAKSAEKDATKAYDYADKIVTAKLPAAVTHLEKYADAAAASALHSAETYADQAVGALRAAENQAIGTAVSIAKTAEADASAALSQAEAYAKSLVAPIPGEIAAGVGAAEAAAGAAVAGVEGQVTALDQYVQGLNLGQIAAGTAALAALVTGVLAETGLSDAACRDKVSNICSTDPAVWSNLLGLLAAIGIALDFRELVRLANDLAPEAAAIVKSAA